MSAMSSLPPTSVRCAEPTCGKLFTPKRWWQRFCSTRCRMKANNTRRREAMDTLRDTERLA